MFEPSAKQDQVQARSMYRPSTSQIVPVPIHQNNPLPDTESEKRRLKPLPSISQIKDISAKREEEKKIKPAFSPDDFHDLHDLPPGSPLSSAHEEANYSKYTFRPVMDVPPIVIPDAPSLSPPLRSGYGNRISPETPSPFQRQYLNLHPVNVVSNQTLVPDPTSFLNFMPRPGLVGINTAQMPLLDPQFAANAYDFRPMMPQQFAINKGRPLVYSYPFGPIGPQSAFPPPVPRAPLNTALSSSSVPAFNRGHFAQVFNPAHMSIRNHGELDAEKNTEGRNDLVHTVSKDAATDMKRTMECDIKGKRSLKRAGHQEEEASPPKKSK